jgi:outer membrane murein-binding lipoprotein Lpp
MFNMYRVLSGVATGAVGAATAIGVMKATEDSAKFNEVQTDLQSLEKKVKKLESKIDFSATLRDLDSVKGILRMHTAQINHLENDSMKVKDKFEKIKNSF